MKRKQAIRARIILKSLGRFAIYGSIFAVVSSTSDYLIRYVLDLRDFLGIGWMLIVVLMGVVLMGVSELELEEEEDFVARDFREVEE